MLWIIVGLLIATLVVVLLRRGGNAAANAINETSTPDFARTASDKLDPAAHQQVYALIAQGKQREAISAYQDATRCTLFEATTAVVALAKHPQESRGFGEGGPAL